MSMKKIGSSTYYVHKSNLVELLNILPDDKYKSKIIKLYEFRKQTGTTPYEIIKYDIKQHKLSLIDSPDWTTAMEPRVGDSWIYNLETESSTFRSGRKDNPQIYHSRELFVNQDLYTGFDIDKAKKRTEEWNSIPGIKDVKKFIGNQNFWFQWCEDNGLMHD